MRSIWVGAIGWKEKYSLLFEVSHQNKIWVYRLKKKLNTPASRKGVERLCLLIWLLFDFYCCRYCYLLYLSLNGYYHT